VITISGANPATVECHTSYTDEGATAADNCAGNLTPTSSSSVDVNTPGSYTVTYAVSDGNGNTQTAARTVNVVDTTAPNITLAGANPMTLDLGATFVEPGATATDTCGGNIPVSYDTQSGVDPATLGSAVGSFTVKYTAVDGSGNSCAVSRVVNVTSGYGGLIAKNQIIFSGGSSLDSFDSSDSSYSTNGKYDTTKRKDGAKAVTNSRLVDAIHVDTAQIYGSVVTGPDGTTTVNGGAVGDIGWNMNHSGIQPGHSANNAEVEFYDVVAPFTSGYVTPKAGTVNGANYTYVVGAGNNQLGSINIGGGKSMIVTGDATLYINGNFTTSGSGYVYIAPGASLKLYMAGKGTVSGTGVINGTERADKLSIYGLNTCTTFYYSGGSQFIGTVYAPYAAFTFSGSAGACGAFAASTITISGGAAVHCDERLNTIFGALPH
jgi:hypothetical protein